MALLNWILAPYWLCARELAPIVGLYMAEFQKPLKETLNNSEADGKGRKIAAVIFGVILGSVGGHPGVKLT